MMLMSPWVWCLENVVFGVETMVMESQLHTAGGRFSNVLGANTSKKEVDISETAQCEKEPLPIQRLCGNYPGESSLHAAAV